MAMFRSFQALVATLLLVVLGVMFTSSSTMMVTLVKADEAAPVAASDVLLPHFNRTKISAMNGNITSMLGAANYSSYQLAGTYTIYPNRYCTSSSLSSSYSMKKCYQSGSSYSYMYLCGGSSTSRTLIEREFDTPDCSGDSDDYFTNYIYDGDCYYYSSTSTKLSCYTDISVSLGSGVVAAIVIVILFVCIVGCICTLSYCGAIMLPGWCIVVSCCRPRERVVHKQTVVMLPTQGYAASDSGSYVSPSPHYMPQQPYYGQQQRV